jgi:hypothetical protein
MLLLMAVVGKVIPFSLIWFTVFLLYPSYGAGGCDQWLSRCIQQGIHGSLKRFCDCAYSAVINFQCTPDYLYCGHMITDPYHSLILSLRDQMIASSSSSLSSSNGDDNPVPPHGCTVRPDICFPSLIMCLQSSVV